VACSVPARAMVQKLAALLVTKARCSGLSPGEALLELEVVLLWLQPVRRRADRARPERMLVIFIEGRWMRGELSLEGLKCRILPKPWLLGL
jgi:hypothetical protein